MSRVVLDASVAIAWCFEDQKSDYSEAVSDALNSATDAVVPMLWTHEVLNVLVRAQIHKRLTQAQSSLLWSELRKLPIEIDHGADNNTSVEIMALAGRHKLTAYAAAYLELAIREGIPLTTLDAELMRAATAAGVKIAFETKSQRRPRPA